jgi:hypothetical protein
VTISMVVRCSRYCTNSSLRKFLVLVLCLVHRVQCNSVV